MPLYYFDLYDGNWSRDEIGADLLNVNQAIFQAKRTLLELALDHASRHETSHVLSMFVTDENRRAVYTATLSLNGLILA